MNFNLNKLGKNAFKNSNRKQIWNEGVSVFELTEQKVYLSQDLMVGLNLLKDSLLSIMVNDDGELCLLNVTGVPGVEEPNCFRMTNPHNEREHFKAVSGRNGILIKDMLNPSKFNMQCGEYTTSTFMRDEENNIDYCVITMREDSTILENEVVIEKENNVEEAVAPRQFHNTLND